MLGRSQVVYNQILILLLHEAAGKVDEFDLQSVQGCPIVVLMVSKSKALRHKVWYNWCNRPGESCMASPFSNSQLVSAVWEKQLMAWWPQFTTVRVCVYNKVSWCKCENNTVCNCEWNLKVNQIKSWNWNQLNRTCLSLQFQLWRTCYFLLTCTTAEVLNL